MSSRSLNQFGAAPTATINLNPAASEDGQALCFDAATDTYSPNGTARTKAALTVTIAGNGSTFGAVTLKATYLDLGDGTSHRLVTLQYAPTASSAALTAAVPALTGTLSDITFAPSDESVSFPVLLRGAGTSDTPAQCTIGTNGVFTIAGLTAMANVIHTLGFCATYRAQAAAP